VSPQVGRNISSALSRSPAWPRVIDVPPLRCYLSRAGPACSAGRRPGCVPFPQDEPVAGTLQVAAPAHGTVPRKTRPVRVPAPGRHTDPSGAVEIVRQLGRTAVNRRTSAWLRRDDLGAHRPSLIAIPGHTESALCMVPLTRQIPPTPPIIEAPVDGEVSWEVPALHLNSGIDGNSGLRRRKPDHGEKGHLRYHHPSPKTDGRQFPPGCQLVGEGPGHA
jgi:hypothetical protein